MNVNPYKSDIIVIAIIVIAIIDIIVKTCSRETGDIFSIAAHVFRNLFLKICPLFGQVLIMCLK